MPVEQLIYTDRPRGKGLDADRSGYQVKASSPDLSAEARRQLESICMHYGDAVYGAAPRAAKERETQWRTQSASLDVVPDEVLREFPVVWSYDRIAEDEYALTRVSYGGLTHDGRFGNFFAHALVFDPSQLERHDFNPLSLSRSDLFRASDPSDDTSLPAFADLDGAHASSSSASSPNADGQLLSRPPYRERLAALLDALCNATPATRPLLLTLADWRGAPALVEALLGLLPPSARCRTTFVTYESDRKWLIPTPAGARPSNLAAAHHLLILSSPEARPFGLRPDEYQAGFAVFNFAEDKFSDGLPAPGAYAVFAAGCVSAGRRDRLRLYHDMIEQLELGRDPQAWGALVPAADLLDARPAAHALAETARALDSFARRPAPAHKALGFLLPHVRRLAEARDAAGLAQLGPHLSSLADRVATDEELHRTQEFVPGVYELAGRALAAGDGRVASALLSACGGARADILLGLLDDALSAEQAALNPGADEADRRATLGLLLEGTGLAQQRPEFASVTDQWLRAAFRTARAAVLLGELWAQAGEKFVKPRLGGEWDADTEQLARDLAADAPAEQGPEASFWLNLKLLEKRPAEGDALRAQLRELARACALCGGDQNMAQELLGQSLSRLPEDDRAARAEVTAQMAEAAHGTTAGDLFFDAYRKELEQAGQGRFKLRRRLAAAGAARVLSRELLAEVLPWDEDRFQPWWREVLRPHENVLDAARGAVAAHLRAAAAPDAAALELADALTNGAAERAPAGSGLAELYQSIALALPLAPLPKRWGRIAASLPEGAARARLRVMEFMRDVGRRADEPGWSVAAFPHTERAWSEDLRQLRPEEKETALGWCLEQFGETGISAPEEAAAFVSVWSAAGAGTPEQIADAVAQLVHKRDQVTKVLAVTAFARCVLEGSRQAESYGHLVRAILDGCDRKTRALFEEHLERRFARRDGRYDHRLRLLCDAAGLSAPPPPAPPPRTPAAPDAQQDQAAWPNVTGILGTAKRSWRKFLGGAGDKPQPEQGGHKNDQDERK